MYQLGSWQLRWLGHDSFQLTNDQLTIYIDPYQVKSGRKGDYFFISHEHYDHFDPPSISALRQINSVIVGPESVTHQLDEMAVPLATGESYEGKGFTVKAVAAYNTNKQFHPKDSGTLGYIFDLGGQTLYHAGDTDIIPEMETYGPVDVALLPVSGTYVMTAPEAAEAVRIIKPKVVIPMHYGAIVGSEADAADFAKAVDGTAEVIILEKEDPQ
jgi:L-ascorbate metabolism protein UlaG (beta-lactamase superfamily)